MIGYIRCDVSHEGIGPARRRLLDAGAFDVLLEVRSPGSVFHPVLDQAIDQLQPGGALIVLGLADLARDQRDVFAIIDRVARKNGHIVILDAGIDTRVDLGAFYTACRALAEHARLRAPTASPVALPGRKLALTSEAAQEARQRLKTGEWTFPVATAKLGVSRATLYRSLRRLESDQAQA